MKDVEENFMLKKPFNCKGNIIIYKCCYDFEKTCARALQKVIF